MCANRTSSLTECQGSPTSFPNPPGILTTIGAAKRLFVRHRNVPQLLSCSVAGSAYFRNWISVTGISPYPFALAYLQDDYERFLVAKLKEAGLGLAIARWIAEKPRQHIGARVVRK